MLDFTSSLYLGLDHPSASLPPWQALTTGVPAVLRAPPGADVVARRLAALQGCERATLATSTLHAAVDLLTQIGRRRPVIHVDAGTYPMLRTGIALARSEGATVVEFPRHDAGALAHGLARRAVGDRPTVVVADGFAPGVGPAPVAAYARIARAAGGVLVIDDTQALGVLGPEGGGSLRSVGPTGAEAVLVCSMAKAFGAPVAAVSGPDAVLRRFEADSAMRVHASPPSAAAISAAARALQINDRAGANLRRALVAVVRRFRRGLARLGLRPQGGLFPVQELGPPEVADPSRVHARLLALGVASVLRSDLDGAPRVAFLLTSRHTPEDIERAVRAVSRALRVTAVRRGPAARLAG